MEFVKKCSEEIGKFLRRRQFDLNRLSQGAAEFLLDELEIINAKFETAGRVDLVGVRKGKERRIEIKLISWLNENRSRLLRAIREMKGQMGSKRLDSLLLLTVTRKRHEIEQGFIKIRDYCILGILVSKSKIEKGSPDEVATEILSKAVEQLEPDEELYGITVAEIIEHSKQISDLQLMVMDLEDQMSATHKLQEKAQEAIKKEVKSLQAEVQKEVKNLQAEVKNTQAEVQKEVKSLQAEVKSTQAEVKNLHTEMKKMEGSIENLRKELGASHQKLDQLLSLLKGSKAD